MIYIGFFLDIQCDRFPDMINEGTISPKTVHAAT